MPFIRARISAKILELLHEIVNPGLYNIDGKKFYITREVFNPKYAFTSKFIVENLFLKPDWTVLDMGTGSGYIAIRIADKVKSVTAIDINDIAVRSCKINIKLNRLENKVKVYRSNLFSALKKSEKFNTIIFNPPYLRGNPENIIQQAWLHRSPETLIKNFAAESRHYLVEKGYIQILYSSISGLKFIKKIFEDEGFKLVFEKKNRLIWETLNFLVFQLTL